MDMTHPMLLDGIKFNMSGNGDAYFIEGSEISKYDSAQQQWIQQGADHRPVGQVQELRLQPGHPGLRLTTRALGGRIRRSRRPSPSSPRRLSPDLVTASVDGVAAVAEDAVVVVARAALAPGRVRRGRCVERVGELVVEEELAGVDLLAADVHLHVDVHGASLVPAGVDGGERGPAVAAGHLGAAQERRVVGAGHRRRRPAPRRHRRCCRCWQRRSRSRCPPRRSARCRRRPR